MTGDFGVRLDDIGRDEIVAEIRSWSKLKGQDSAPESVGQSAAGIQRTTSPLQLEVWSRLWNGRAGVDAACGAPWPDDWHVVYEVRRLDVADQIYGFGGMFLGGTARVLVVGALAMVAHASAQLAAQGFPREFILANAAGAFDRVERVEDIPGWWQRARQKDEAAA